MSYSTNERNGVDDLRTIDTESSQDTIFQDEADIVLVAQVQMASKFTSTSVYSAVKMGLPARKKGSISLTRLSEKATSVMANSKNESEPATMSGAFLRSTTRPRVWASSANQRSIRQLANVSQWDTGIDVVKRIDQQKMPSEPLMNFTQTNMKNVRLC